MYESLIRNNSFIAEKIRRKRHPLSVSSSSLIVSAMNEFSRKHCPKHMFVCISLFFYVRPIYTVTGHFTANLSDRVRPWKQTGREVAGLYFLVVPGCRNM